MANVLSRGGLGALCACCAGLAWAAPTGSTVTLVSVLNTGASSTMTLLTPACWSDDQLPHADADYVVGLGGIRLPDGAGNAYVFDGNSVQLGTDTQTTSLYHKQAELTFAHDGIFLKKGTWGHWASGAKPKVNGTVTVLSKASAPFVFTSDNRDTGYNFTGAWHAAADCGIRVQATNPATSYDAHRLILSGDLSDFNGSISVQSRAILTVGTTAMPGSIDMPNAAPGAGWLEAYADDTVFDVANLTLRSGVRLAPKARLATADAPATGSVFRVTGKLDVLSAPVYVVMPAGLVGRGEAAEQRVPVLTLAAGAEGTLDVADFAISNTVAALPSVQVSLDVATDAQTGDTTLYIVRKPVIVLTQDSSGNDPHPDDAGRKGNWGALSTPNYWSDGLTPHPGAIYDGNGHVCRTLYDGARDEFLGDALIFSGGNFVLQSKVVIVPELYFRTSAEGKVASLSNWHANGDKTVNTFAKGGTKVLRGDRMVLDAQVNSSFSSVGTYLKFDLPIEGAGKISWAMEANQPAGWAYVEFAGDNTKWTGQMALTARNGKAGSTTPYRLEHTYTNTLETFFGEACNLGGPRPVFDAQALHLSGKVLLHPLRSVELDEATRGIWIDETGAGFRMDAGTTLTVRQQLTLVGELAKFGAGTLAFGGPLAFGAANVYDPPAGKTFSVDVQEGGVKSVAKDAANGLTFRFGAEGFLAADPAATGDAATYGLCDVKTDMPFDLANCPDGKVPVRVELPADYADSPHVVADVPVCTVSAAAAESLGAAAFAVRRPKGCSASVASRVNDDGTVTYLATIGPGGLVFLVK